MDIVINMVGGPLDAVMESPGAIVYQHASDAFGHIADSPSDWMFDVMIGTNHYRVMGGEHPAKALKEQMWQEAKTGLQASIAMNHLFLVGGDK